MSKKQKPKTDRNDKIVEQYRAGSTCQEIAEELPISYQRVHQILQWRDVETRENGPRGKEYFPNEYTEEEIIEAIQELENKHGYISNGLLESSDFSFNRGTVNDYLGKLHEIAWRADVDLKEFDYTTNYLSNITFNSEKYTDKELLSMLHNAMAEKGSYLTASECNQRDDLPSHTTYTIRFGSWRRALNKARKYENKPGGKK